MDVLCATCHEPWEAEYLKFDLVADSLLTVDNVDLELANAAMQFSKDHKLTKPVRDFMRGLGWEFGVNVLVIKRCESCNPDDKIDPELAAAQDALADILGDDEDGYLTEMDDLFG